MEDALLIGLVKLRKACGEDAEGGADEDTARIALVQLSGDLQGGVAGGDHIVNDDDVLAFYGSPQEFMGQYRILSVHGLGVVPSLIEHTHIDAQDVRHIDRAGGSRLIRADDHQMFRRDVKIRRHSVEALDELVDRTEVLESRQRDRILDPGIVRFEGDDVLNTHPHQILQSLGAVKRLTHGPAVLAALVQIRHDDVDAPCLSADRCDHPLQIDEMIIRRHVVDLSAERICDAVITHIHQKEDVVASDRIKDGRLAFTAAEPRGLGADQVIVPDISMHLRVGGTLVLTFRAPAHDIIVDLFSHLFTGRKSDDAKIADGHLIQILIGSCLGTWNLPAGYLFSGAFGASLHVVGTS